MNRSILLSAFVSFVAGVLGTREPARGQCMHWSSEYGLGTTSLNDAASVLLSYDDGSGRKLYAGGDLPYYISHWNGTHWTPVGLFGLNDIVVTLCPFDTGSGMNLYAGGVFTVPSRGIARWNGSAWLGVGGGVLNGSGFEGVSALAVYDAGSGPGLYVGGYFSQVGSTQASNIARWNGTTWSALGSGLDGFVYALAVFDDGTGPALYASGVFTHAGGLPVNGIAKWNGASWSALGSGAGGGAFSMVVFDDGSGPALYSGSGPEGISRWDGSSWTSVGGGLNGSVAALAVFDDGRGRALYAGGNFTQASGVQTLHVARWDGTPWSPLGSGLSSDVTAFTVHDPGNGPALVVGGKFLGAGATAFRVVVAWRACTTPIDSFCFGDGTVAGCPCSDLGARGHGCQNSSSSGGARLSASGSTNPDTIALHAAGELPNALTIFLQGDDLLSGGIAFGDGLRCIDGHLVRLYVTIASNGIALAPEVGSPSISSRSAEAGDPIAPGSTRYYQAHYRDADASYCTAATFNVSNGVRIVW